MECCTREPRAFAKKVTRPEISEQEVHNEGKATEKLKTDDEPEKLKISSRLSAEVHVGATSTSNGRNGQASEKFKIFAQENPKPNNNDEELGKSEGFSAKISLVQADLGSTLQIPFSRPTTNFSAQQTKAFRSNSVMANHLGHPSSVFDNLQAPTETRVHRKKRKHRRKQIRWALASGFSFSASTSPSEAQREPSSTKLGASKVVESTVSAEDDESNEEVTDEEYHKFYHSLAKDFGDEKPLAWSHFTTEGELDELLPTYLSFLTGLVDSDTLPLNVSQVRLQQHSSLMTIKKQLTRKALDMIRRIAYEAPNEFYTGEVLLKRGSYAKFWKEFGKSIKLGIIEDATNTSRLAKLLRFESTNKGKLAPPGSVHF
ncbi:endoplasmin homolog [Aristolochia californica]|uniref:endoplasmin homolog n=1 Tax=Aristolochia californica TaxID=171875 RepID=UPI0035DED332